MTKTLGQRKLLEMTKQLFDKLDQMARDKKARKTTVESIMADAHVQMLRTSVDDNLQVHYGDEPGAIQHLRVLVKEFGESTHLLELYPDDLAEAYTNAKKWVDAHDEKVKK